ncbi:DUF334 domain-containing protein, partial [Campylobacter jejuni]|nr:DUF334 domain-containing protein [Campylobacter jejuni]
MISSEGFLTLAWYIAYGLLPYIIT